MLSPSIRLCSPRAEKATQPWILNLDADEVVTPELRDEIQRHAWRGFELGMRQRLRDFSFLPAVLHGIEPGDNIVWEVDDIEDYRELVVPYASAARAASSRSQPGRGSG